MNSIVARHGLKPSDISVVGIGPNAARTLALETGKVDAGMLGDPGASILEKRYPELVVLADTRAPEGTAAALGAAVYPGGVLVASDAWLERNRESAARLVRGVLRTIEWIRKTPVDQVALRDPHNSESKILMFTRTLWAGLSQR